MLKQSDTLGLVVHEIHGYLRRRIKKMDSREIGGRLKKKERKKERKRIYVNVLHTF